MLKTRLLLGGVVLLLSGCSGTRPMFDDTPTDRGGDRYDYAVSEAFDASQYADSLVVSAEIQHDVPDALMGARAAEGVVTERTIQGYRIQIHSSLERDSALRVEDDVERWWRGLDVEGRPLDYQTADLPVLMQFVTPYYRVRVGAFQDRSSAEALLEFFRQRYSDAFLVLDSITIYR